VAVTLQRPMRRGGQHNFAGFITVNYWLSCAWFSE